MRVLYGVTGEGMGHATRSRVTIEHLLRRGHQLKVVVSGRAYEYLKKNVPAADVVEITGFEMKYKDGAMDRDATVMNAVLGVPTSLLDNVKAYYEDVKRWAPEAVVSDFESFAYLYGRRHSLPILSIDNQQIISRCKHDAAITIGHSVDFQSTKAFIKLKLPACERYLVTTFFYPPVKEKYAHNTVLVPPILRDVILAAKAKATEGEHVLVYQTQVTDTRLLDALNALRDTRFIVYGLRRDEVRGNCVIKSFSEQGFVDDLASARGVVANGGLSLIGEALYLGKPLYTVPVRHQFEQVMNARYIENLGLGMSSEEFEPEVLAAFLKDAPNFAAQVKKSHAQQGNDVLYREVDKAMVEFAAKVRDAEQA